MARGNVCNQAPDTADLSVQLLQILWDARRNAQGLTAAEILLQLQTQYGSLLTESELVTQLRQRTRCGLLHLKSCGTDQFRYAYNRGAIYRNTKNCKYADQLLVASATFQGRDSDWNKKPCVKGSPAVSGTQGCATGHCFSLTSPGARGDCVQRTTTTYGPPKTQNWCGAPQ